MKKILIGAITILLMAGTIFSAQADNQATIDVTMNPSAQINITCNQSSWSPIARIDENESTSTAWGRLSNVGDVNVSVNVSATDSVNWTLAATPDHNQFELRMYISASWTDLTTTNQTFSGDISPIGTNYIDFGLWLFMPTSSSTPDPQTSTITFTATTL